MRSLPRAAGSKPVVETRLALEGMDSLRGSSVKVGTIQRILAWPLRKDDTRKSRSGNKDSRWKDVRETPSDVSRVESMIEDVPETTDLLVSQNLAM